jgi:adenine-specific DNA-methyltransferase
VFGRGNFIATAIWQKNHARNNSAQHLSADHDFVLAYARSLSAWQRNKVSRTEASDADFWNPDEDARGMWRRSDLTAAKPYADGHYEVVGPHGDRFVPRANRYWSISRQTFEQLLADNRVWWGKTGRTFPFRKRFQSELGELVPTTIWLNEEVGDNREAKQEVTRIFGREDIFGTPKPERLMERIIHIATNPGDLVLDSFLGSGTTAAVAHKMGRRWIGIEMGEHAITHCLPRLAKVVEGEQGGISAAVNWHGGGGFRVQQLGAPLFDARGDIDAYVRFADLAAFVWMRETGQALDALEAGTPRLGVHENTAYYLLFNGVLGDRRPAGGNVLNGAVLDALRAACRHDGPKVVYGEACRLGAARLDAAGIVFKQLPHALPR